MTSVTVMCTLQTISRTVRTTLNISFFNYYFTNDKEAFYNHAITINLKLLCKRRLDRNQLDSRNVVDDLEMNI